MTAVQSVVAERANGGLIARVAPLWLHGREPVLDMTYGRGLFWTKYRPETLVTNDINRTLDADMHQDFRELDIPDKVFGATVFDPPYVVMGGRETSGIPEMQERYGMGTAPKTVQEMKWLMIDGIIEAFRVTRPKGVILVKCQDYISSGRYVSGYENVCQAFHHAGFRLEDVFVHLSGSGPQPGGRRQVHSRRTHSYLIVGQK